MCPACIASVAWAVVGVSSTGGLTLLAATKHCDKTHAKKTSTQSESKEKSS